MPVQHGEPKAQVTTPWAVVASFTCVLAGLAAGFLYGWNTVGEPVPDAGYHQRAQEVLRTARISLPPGFRRVLQEAAEYEPEPPDPPATNEVDASRRREHRTDVASIVERYEILTEPPTPGGSVRELLGSQRPLAVADISEVLATQPYLERLARWAAILSHARVSDHPVLLEYLSNEERLPAQRFIAEALIRRWARSEPESALRILSLDPLFKHAGDRQEAEAGWAQRCVVEEWVKFDSEGAAEVVHRIPATKRRSELLAIVLPHLSDLRRALDFAGTLTPSDTLFPAEIKRQILARAARDRPEEVLDLFGSYPIDAQCFNDLFEALSRKDLARAQTYADAMPSSIHRIGAAEALVEIWRQSDPPAAWKWAKALKPDWIGNRLSARALDALD